MAALIVESSSCISNSGFAGSVLTLCPLRLWSGPSCWTSWTVWTRFTVFALVVDPGNGLCWAGFAGIVPRAVFLFVVVRPKMLRIMAGMTQRDTYVAGFAGFAPRAVFLPVVYRPVMLGIMAFLDQKDSYAATLWQWHVQCSFCWYFHLAMSSSRGFLAQMPCRQARR